MSAKQSVVRKAIPLCGIVLVLGTIACDRVSFYSYSVDPAPAQAELLATVRDFLKNVPANQRSTFDRFFGDEVIYTRATGQVVTKKDILADTGNPAVPRANATFEAQEFNVHQYRDLAIVNFKLVMQATDNDKPVTRTFRNTAAFMKRNGQWQAIAWQATPIAATP